MHAKTRPKSEFGAGIFIVIKIQIEQPCNSKVFVCIARATIFKTQNFKIISQEFGAGLCMQNPPQIRVWGGIFYCDQNSSRAAMQFKSVRLYSKSDHFQNIGFQIFS
jgi:hypothetical protein